MKMVLRILAILIGIGFLLPGLAGVFRTERLAEILALAPETSVGLVTIQVLIGAPYIAMSIATIYGAVRREWLWIAPVALTEGMMAVVRILSGFMHGFDAAGVGTIVTEVVVCIILSLAVILPTRSAK